MNNYTDSELTFGGYDNTKFTGDITWHSVVDQLFWSLNLTDILYNGVPMNICAGKTCMVTPDSGTSLITVPSWALDTITNTLPYSEGCPNDLDFGNLTFVIDGVNYDIPSNHFMELYYNVYTMGDSICTTSITSLDIMQEG